MWTRDIFPTLLPFHPPLRAAFSELDSLKRENKMYFSPGLWYRYILALSTFCFITLLIKWHAFSTLLSKLRRQFLLMCQEAHWVSNISLPFIRLFTGRELFIQYNTYSPGQFYEMLGIAIQWLLLNMMSTMISTIWNGALWHDVKRLWSGVNLFFWIVTVRSRARNTIMQQKQQSLI